MDRRGKAIMRTLRLWRAGGLVICGVLSGMVPGRAAEVTIVLDRAGYNAGTTVEVRVMLGAPPDAGARLTALRGTVTYNAGGTERQVAAVALTAPQPFDTQGTTAFAALWRVPREVETGVYRLHVSDVVLEDAAGARLQNVGLTHGGEVLFNIFRQDLWIREIVPDKGIYTSGDPFRVRIRIGNTGTQDFRDVAIAAFSVNAMDQYPWISKFSRTADLLGRVRPEPDRYFVYIKKGLTIPAGQTITTDWLTVIETPRRRAPDKIGTSIALGDATMDDVYTYAVMPSRPMVKPASVHTPKPYEWEYFSVRRLDDTYYGPPGPQEVPPPPGPVAYNHESKLYAPGEAVRLRGRPGGPPARGALLIRDPGGAIVLQADGWDGSAVTWRIPADAPTGLYDVEVRTDERHALRDRFAVNHVPETAAFFAPHPDDEASIFGLAQVMRASDRPFTVVSMTSGDASLTLLEVYWGGIMTPNQYIEYGNLRMQETRWALAHLGMNMDRDWFTLGMPDGGSGPIFYQNLTRENPYRSPVTGCDRSPYANAYEPNMPHAKEAVVDNIKKILQARRPTDIFTPHPEERHPDHRLTNDFVLAALRELKSSGYQPRVHVYVSYGKAADVSDSPLQYHREGPFFLSDVAFRKRQEAGWAYISQHDRLKHLNHPPAPPVTSDVVWFRQTGW